MPRIRIVQDGLTIIAADMEPGAKLSDFLREIAKVEDQLNAGDYDIQTDEDMEQADA